MPSFDTTDIGLFILRLTFGILTFAHGVLKIRSLDKFAASWHLSLHLAAIVMIMQTTTGIAIIVGFATQIAALCNVVINVGVLYFLLFKSDEPFMAPGQHSWSIGVAYLGMAAAIAALGAGAFSLDAILF